MDLLFKRYANPFFILDEMLMLNRLEEFVCTLINEIVDKETLWEVYLHSIYTQQKPFNDYVRETTEQPEPATLEELEAIINTSRDMLSNFNPSENGGDE